LRPNWYCRWGNSRLVDRNTVFIGDRHIFRDINILFMLEYVVKKKSLTIGNLNCQRNLCDTATRILHSRNSKAHWEKWEVTGWITGGVHRTFLKAIHITFKLFSMGLLGIEKRKGQGNFFTYSLIFFLNTQLSLFKSNQVWLNRC
jgi:hypothetical protein